MAEQALKFLQRVADHTPVYCTMRVASGDTGADLRLDQKREHVNREGVSEHMRRDVQVEATGATARIGPQKSRLPSCGTHRIASVGQPNGRRFGRRTSRGQNDKACTLARTHDVETATLLGLAPPASISGAAPLPLQHMDGNRTSLPAAADAPSCDSVRPLDADIVVDPPQRRRGMRISRPLPPLQIAGGSVTGTTRRHRAVGHRDAGGRRQKARRLLKPQAGRGEEFREESVALAVLAPPGRVAEPSGGVLEDRHLETG